MADPFNVTGHSEALGLPKGSPRDSSEAYEGQSSAPVVADVDGEAWRKDADCRLRYGILDNPPWWECLILGAQQYLTMLGSTVLIPFLIVPAMGGTEDDKARVISTIFFISGIVTLIQTFVGDRLPIIQGGSFAYLTPVFSIAAAVKAGNPEWAKQDATEPNHERFLYTMRVVSGGIAGSAFIILFLGASGLINLLLQYISPITVSANIAIVGLALYTAGFPAVGACVQLGLPMIGFIVLFSMYLRNVAIPIPYVGRLRLFEMFPILLAIIFNWVIAIIVTESGHYDHSSAKVQANCRTDQSDVLSHSPWIRFPYPGQWGGPIFTGFGVVACFAGAISAMVESLGDYYAAARISGAPVPPPAVLSRAVAIQGLSCVMTGFWGTGNGTTAYNENIGAMQITRVGSRRVVQVGACIAIIFGLIGKFGGVFASMPQAMVAGLFCVMFSLIAAVGISQLQFTDMNSPRNIFILGFAIYMGLSIPDYFSTFGPTVTTLANGTPITDAAGNSLSCRNPNLEPINTHNQNFNVIFNVVFNTAAADALIITMFLDNTIPGTLQERGLHVWLQQGAAAGDWWADDRVHAVYGWPFGLSRTFGKWLKPYTARRDAMVTSVRSSIHGLVHPIVNCLTCGKRANHATAQGP